MRLFRATLCGAFACLFFSTASARAEAPPSPLRLIPDEADFVVQVDSPRKLIEAYTTADQLQQLYKLDAFKEYLDSTNVRRFYQLVAYFEKQSGDRWPDLLDKVAGGGIAVGSRFGPTPAPVLAVIQSKDAEALEKFLKLGLQLVEQELIRLDVKAKLERTRYRDLATVKIGNDFHLARAGSALLISNREEALKRGLDLHLDGGKNTLANVPSIAEAKKLLPESPLAWMWLNMQTVHKAPEAKEVFTLPRNDLNLTVLFGGWLDVAGRAPFLCAALCKQGNEFYTTVRMPRGREGSQEAMGLHIPPKGEGALPLLEPKGVMYSTSYYLDLAKIWNDRSKLMSEKTVKDFEEFDSKSGLFLTGKKFSEMVNMAGPHQRFVAVHQEKRGYKTIPGQRFPAFALVVDGRKEEFGKSMESILRAAGFLANTQVSTKISEEKHGDYTIVGYRFVEDPKNPPKQGDVLYNFSPCFVAVGDQFVVASTIELAHDLVDILHKEQKDGVKKSKNAIQTRLYGEGGADYLKSIDELLFAQTMLDRALPPAQAKEQVREFLDVIRKFGTLQIDSDYAENDFRYDIRLVPGK